MCASISGESLKMSLDDASVVIACFGERFVREDSEGRRRRLSLSLSSLCVKSAKRRGR